MKPRYIYKWGVGPVRVKEIRQRYRDDGKRLRRARRLYAQIVHDAILSHATERLLWDCTERMINRHLYSTKAGVRDVRNGLLRHLFKVSKSKGWMSKNGYCSWRDWFEWLNEYDFDMPGKASNKNRTRHQRHFKVA